MRTLIYLIWLCLPLFFFLMALWGKLEQISKSDKKHRPLDLFKQGLFVSFCVAISVLIDQYLLEFISDSLLPEYIPLGAYQALTLPVVLFIAALAFGPTEVIRISKAPKSKYRSKK